MYREKKRYGQDPTKVVRSAAATFNAPLAKSRDGSWKMAPGSRVFVCSWSDFLHREADDWRDDAWDVMRQRPDLTFIIVTKRPERFEVALPGDWNVSRAEMSSVAKAPLATQDAEYRNRTGDAADHGRSAGWPNVWGLVSVENQEAAEARIPILLQTPFAVRGISAEPLLGELDLAAVMTSKAEQVDTIWGGAIYSDWINALTGNRHYNGIGCVIKQPGNSLDWVICGGESGPDARPMDREWARNLRDQCKDSGVAFFMKQMAGLEAIPDDLMVREFPEVGQVASTGCLI